MPSAYYGRARNSLAQQINPFLVARSTSPIQWQTWGKAAVARARRQIKPLLLSIDQAGPDRMAAQEAALERDSSLVRMINKHFVPVKVDREEYPEVDYYCSQAVSMLAGRQHWPYLICLTPQGHPWTAWYSDGDNNLKALVERLILLWQEKRAHIEVQAQALTMTLGKIENAFIGVNAMPLNHELMEQYWFNLKRNMQGRFSRAALAAGQQLELFLFEIERTGDEQVAHLVRTVLDELALGDTHDELNGGFFSQAETGTDAHREKLLRVNLQAARCFTHAYRLLGKQSYAKTALQTMSWILRTLRLKNGFLGRACWVQQENPASALLDKRWPLGANALAVTTLLDMGRYLNRLDYLRQAETLLQALANNFKHGEGYHRLGSERGYFGKATLQDWALLSGAMLDMAKINPSGPWLRRGRNLVDRISKHFAVPQASWGMGNYAPVLADPLFQTQHPFDDGLASGQALVAQQWLSLAQRTKMATYQEKVFNLLNAYYHVALNNHHGLNGLMLVYARFLDQHVLTVLPDAFIYGRQWTKKMGPATACLRLARPTIYAGGYLAFDFTLTPGPKQEVVMTMDKSNGPNTFILSLAPEAHVEIRRLSLSPPEGLGWQGECVKEKIYRQRFELKGFIKFKDGFTPGKMILHWRLCLNLRQADRKPATACLQFKVPVLIKSG